MSDQASSGARDPCDTHAEDHQNSGYQSDWGDGSMGLPANGALAS